MVLVRFEPLNPPHPRSRFWQSVFWQLLGNSKFLASVIPASLGNSSVQSFCRQAIGDIPFRRSCCCDKLLGNSYARSGCWGIPLWKVLKVSVCLFFESLQRASKAAATLRPEPLRKLPRSLLFAACFLQAPPRAVILNPAGRLRRFGFDGLVAGSVLVRVLRCCEWQERPRCCWLIAHDARIPFFSAGNVKKRIACALDPDHSRQHCLQGEGGALALLCWVLLRVCILAELGFQVFILCAVCLHPLIPARSGFCLCQLFAVLWFCLLCFTTGYCIHCQKASVFRVHFRKTA